LEIGADAAAEGRQRLAELDDALELLLLARGAEPGVVEVLRAPLLVHADGLQRRGVAAGDAYVLPRRRDAQHGDASERLLVFDRLAVRGAVREASRFRPFATDSLGVEVPTAPDCLYGHVPGDFCENGAACPDGRESSSSRSPPPSRSPASPPSRARFGTGMRSSSRPRSITSTSPRIIHTRPASRSTFSSAASCASASTTTSARCRPSISLRRCCSFPRCSSSRARSASTSRRR